MATDHSFSPSPSRQETRPITRAALYARVSTLTGQNPEMQLSELREYASRRGWAVANEYVDRGVSGAKESRPALNKLMADAHRRRFDAVLVWKLDRFARSLKQLVNALAEMEALGVAFVSLRDNLDLSTPSGRLMFQIIGAMAEFERALIQERVRAGLRHARAQGKRLGRPGVNVEVKRELRAQGASLRAIARKLGVGLGTVHRALPARFKILCGAHCGKRPHRSLTGAAAVLHRSAQVSSVKRSTPPLVIALWLAGGIADQDSAARTHLQTPAPFGTPGA